MSCDVILGVFQENVAPTKEQCCAFGSYLGMVDPWYNCHIRSLGVTIPELAKKVHPYNTQNLQPTV